MAAIAGMLKNNIGVDVEIQSLDYSMFMELLKRELLEAKRKNRRLAILLMELDGYEAAVNAILDDLVEALSPRYARMTAIFNVRGGVYTTVEAEYWQEQEL